MTWKYVHLILDIMPWSFFNSKREGVDAAHEHKHGHDGMGAGPMRERGMMTDIKSQSLDSSFGDRAQGVGLKRPSLPIGFLSTTPATQMAPMPRQPKARPDPVACWGPAGHQRAADSTDAGGVGTRQFGVRIRTE
jgi:hypothetical protein